MSIPLLSYSFSTQNQRVDGCEVVPGEEQPRIYSTESLPSSSDMNEIIWAAYRQIFSEHQILKYTKQSILESLFRFNQITVRDFIKGLLKSNSFRKINYDVNNNYRFAELCVQRALGRDVYSEREKIAWSIVIATQGIEGFVDMLCDSDEYLENFGDNIVPYQRRRIIPQRVKGQVPFNLKTPRYGKDFTARLGMPNFTWQGAIRSFRPQEKTIRSGDPAAFLNMVSEVVSMF
uniref:phycytochrome bilisome rod-core linker protein n=1 Tax=Pulvinaster venetus TaxID=427767 RepID=UPI001FCD321E|nr:phycytochrome bilisome rod-core linker protein [Pulvinaster venetus]UNJ17012.1 phycytochrome bilisome rod-core linker protein [Pulvinaster venetus]